MVVRRIELSRGAWGLALLAAPRAVLALDGAGADGRAVTVTRILGARQLAQAALSGIDPSPEVLAMGVWVDVAHALSAVGLAAADRRRIRSGLTDAVIASSWAALGDHDLRTGATPPPDHDRRRDALARLVLRIVPGGGPLLRRAQADRSHA